MSEHNVVTRPLQRLKASTPVRNLRDARRGVRIPRPLHKVFGVLVIGLGAGVCLTALAQAPSSAPPPPATQSQAPQAGAPSGAGSAPEPSSTTNGQGQIIPEPLAPGSPGTPTLGPSGPPLESLSFDVAPAAPSGEWHLAAHDFANSRYSDLDQINTGNVNRLRVAWTFADGTINGHEAAPLVVGDTMYLITPFPNNAYALDLSQPGIPIKWVYKPNPRPIAMGKACCDTVNRGGAWADGKLVYNLLDGHTVAVDTKTGQEVWRTLIGQPAQGLTLTMAPLIVGDKVFVGVSGGELGVRGFLEALSLKDGHELWRAYSTGSDKDVLIGPEFHPFYQFMQGHNLGETTWPADAWRHGGGTTWGWISYDPATNLIFYGTSNPGPRVPVQRPGINLWTSTVFARDADTGMARWAYQFTPHDQWDYDGVNENLLADLDWNGQRRHVLIHFDRNAFAYVLDRATGEVLEASPFAYQNWSLGIDLKTGMPRVNPEEEPVPEKKLPNVCPPDIGGKDWQPSAMSPRTGLVYAGIFNICMELTDHRVSYIPGTPYDGMQMKRHAGPGGNWGEFMAWDPVKGRKAWSIREKFMTMSGALATAGDVVFYGTADGWFRAVHARTGAVLWSTKLGSGVIGQPIAFLGPDHREYIAIYSGIGGAAMVSQTEPGFPARGGTLYVFSVDGASPNTVNGMSETKGGGARQGGAMGAEVP